MSPLKCEGAQIFVQLLSDDAGQEKNCRHLLPVIPFIRIELAIRCPTNLHKELLFLVVAMRPQQQGVSPFHHQINRLPHWQAQLGRHMTER